ncbi:hypothetical protein RHIZ_02860 [Rhizobium skierniewicense]|uniref:hypothetical protein n=1 Tax=Rhizobium skierniewicense TaxID=984260 RepID=UPI001FAD620E|nr:hypothetical protein [Rhizobium skierniewicense]MCI9864881.1 hypothetical protein [Rhizobium skierniewicense]
MKEQPGTGGSYIEQPDGSLKRVAQTQPAKAREAATKADPAPVKTSSASSAKKDA